MAKPNKPDHMVLDYNPYAIMIGNFDSIKYPELAKFNQMRYGVYGFCCLYNDYYAFDFFKQLPPRQMNVPIELAFKS